MIVGFQYLVFFQLADTRGRRTARFTLLHYLVDVLKEQDPMALGVVTEMCSVPKAADGKVSNYCKLDE